MKISLATTLFNITKNDFDLYGSLSNWSRYVDEIVIATIESEDDTYERLDKLNNNFKSIPIKIIKTDLKFDDNEFDGKLKNEAHQNSSHEIVIQCDGDERLSGKPEAWRNFADQLYSNKDHIKALMIPVINLWGSYYMYSDISKKWYMSVKEGTKRGVVNFARNEDGTFDIEKSDSCEILDNSGNLVNSLDVMSQGNFADQMDYFKQELPFIWHLGGLDLNRRANMNKWWKPHWENRSGSEVDNIVLDEKELDKKEVFEHNLVLDFLDN